MKKLLILFFLSLSVVVNAQRIQGTSLSVTGDYTASTISSNQNNYVLPAGYYNYRLSASTPSDITGLSMAGTRDGAEVVITNVSANAITLKHDDSNSIAANRIIIAPGVDLVLGENFSVSIRYDKISQRWRVKGNFSGVSSISQPQTQDSNIQFSAIASDAATISWTHQDGDFSILVVDDAPIAEFPAENVSYSPNLQIGLGDQIGNAYVMAIIPEANPPTADITGLTENTTYYAVVFSFNQQGGAYRYNTTVGSNSGNFLTLSDANTPTQQWVTTNIRSEEDRLKIQGIRGNGDNIVVLASTEGAPNTDIADGVNPTAGPYGTGTAVGNAYVVYEGAAHDFHITGFPTRDRMVWLKIMEREDTGFLHNTQAPIDSAWLALVYDSLFTEGASPLLTNLVSYWKMDETSSITTIDDIHGGLDASVTGTITSETGKINGALRFSGTQHADVANNASLNPTTSITVQAWIYISASVSTSQAIVSKVVADGSHNDPYFSWSLQLQPGIAIRFWVATSSGSDVVSASGFTTDTWYHVVGKYTSGAMSITINGTKTSDATPRTGTLNQYTSPVRFAANGTPGEYFNGRIEEVAVWDRVLSDAEITELYNSGNGLAYPFTGSGFDDWTPHEVVGFTYSTVDDTLNLSGNPAGFQDYILRNEIIPDTLQAFDAKYTFKISGPLTTSTIGTGPIVVNDLSSEANRAVYSLFVTDTDNPNFGRLQLYSGNGTVASPTAITFRSQTSGAFIPAEDSVYSISLSPSVDGANLLWTARITDLYDSSELTTSWTEVNAPSSAFLGSTTQVGIWQNGGPFKINPFSVVRNGLDLITAPPPGGGGGGTGTVTYEVFVDINGNDANNCSEASKCRTWARGFARVDELGPGTDMFVGPGTFIETTFSVIPTDLDTLDGAGDNQTIVKGASNLYVDITAGAGNGNPFSSYGYLFSCSSASPTNVTTVMRNFTMEGNRNVGGYDNSMKGGIFVNNRNRMNLDNVDIKYFWNAGIWAQSVDSLVIRGCHLQENSFSNPAPAPTITYAFGNLQLFGTTTKIWVINSFIDSPVFDQGQGIQHSGAPNFYRVDLHVHRSTFDIGNSSDAEGHQFAAEILYYFMNNGDSISFQNNFINKNTSFNFTGPELGVHYFHGNQFDLSLNPYNLAIESQFGNAEVCHNIFLGMKGKCLGTYNQWGSPGVCPRDCHPDNQVWDNYYIHDNVFEFTGGAGFVDGIIGDFRWRRNNLTVENNTFKIINSGTSWVFIQPGNQGVSDNWLIQNNAIDGVPPTGSVLWGGSTLTNSIFRNNKATNLNITATKSGVTSSNNTVTGSGNTLGFNLTGPKYPVVSGSYYAWPASNTVLKNTGFGGADIGAFRD